MAPPNDTTPLPISLRINRTICTVIGYGPVGQRKAELLAAAGAVLRVVDPRADRLTPDAHPHWEWIAAAYDPEHLTGSRLIVAAATPDINRQVVADARARGLWISSASDPEQSDFEFPAVGRLGQLSLAISTNGTSPTLARRLRTSLLASLDPMIKEWIDILSELRSEVLHTLPDEPRRYQLLNHFADESWLVLLHTTSPDEVRSRMRQAIQDAGASLGIMPGSSPPG